MELFRSVNLMSAVFMLHKSMIEHRKKLCNKNDAPAEAWDLSKNVQKLNDQDKNMFFSLSEVMIVTSTIFEEDSGKIICGRL